MSDFKNTKEIYEHLLAGGKVYRTDSEDNVSKTIIYFKDDGDLTCHIYSFRDFKNWTKHIEPKKKVKLYKYAFLGVDNTWGEAISYFKDDEAFKDIFSAKKFFKLENHFIEVDEE